MQAWFRSIGGFSYSLERDPGTSASHLMDFLANRIGYCEQFAATMAIMARAIGIPARVAVGFTPGEQQDDGSWIVRAHDSHAWPELFFNGIGWVRFEPTPSTRTNAAPAWTLPVRTTEENSGTPQGGNSNAESPENQLGPESSGNLAADDLGGAGATDQASRWLFVLVVAAIVAVLLCTPQAVARVTRANRWRRADGDPVLEAEAAWNDFRDAVRDAGLRWNAAATPRGVRRLVHSQLNLDADADDLVWRLVRTIERARYAAVPVALSGLRADARALRAIILRSRSRRRRITAWLWPAAVQDLLAAGTAATAEGLTWLDSAGERLRTRLAPAGRR
jgi:hypothetical protein